MNFKPGDKVLVYRDHHDTNPYPTTVYKANARYVTLMNGERYTQNGEQWGASGEWFRRRIEKETA